MRLVIVSNRLPVTFDEKLNITESIGGLAKGLNTFLQHYIINSSCEYLWVGWAGSQIENHGTSNDLIQTQLKNFSCHAVKIDNALMDDFYGGFCNKTIWPIFHNLTEFFSYNEAEWQVYQQVNLGFATEILEILQADDIIWIHDYHLLLLAFYLKQHKPDLVIGLFLHIPFPSFGLFQFLPKKCRTDILDGMLWANQIGFHTYEYAQNFLKCATRMLGYDYNIDTIITNDHLVKVGVYPMGIDFIKIQEILAKLRELGTIKSADQQIGSLKMERYKIILSIDRLDYTKGIDKRLLGYEEFLKHNTQWHKRVVLNLIVAPSRECVLHYHNMKRQIDELVGNINGKFGHIDWVPISYQYRSFDTESLIFIFATSDVALVTPIVDGMNLIAKEFIAAKTNSTGVLVLSEGAGAAKELMDALIVNPNSKEELAEAIKLALEMPESEQSQMLKNMQKRIKRYNVIKWGDDFIKDLQTVYDNQREFNLKFASIAQLERIKYYYKKCSSRVLIFDYDGTLVPLTNNINVAYPGSDLIELLNALIQNQNNHLIIISGRNKNKLQEWLHNIDITLIAEHGAWVRLNGVWQTTQVLDPQLKMSTMGVIESFMDKLPGSFIEEKDFSLAWHYRNADPENAKQVATELLDTLVMLTANSELQVLNGNKVIEIRPAGVNKGIVEKFISSKNYDFILAMGDDITDEDMFKALPKQAFTLKIGSQASFAKLNIISQKKAIDFIRQLSICY